ncbi:hypothetical protein SISSUDRAFT_270765 [Sistotremastrum suecicum HHB10207 ss-3]|uniref:Uncharacterized protein n=1 Tax=Sistotremastrum suecicum HHB10207 ss-3 TaxID=1314776 RepID=A0A165ZQQ1_9AGAM|nr:hypothetical protein SISSUDRAFT_270765 [Sistotremastrum suecicum HHB10207 ss-3]
MGSSWSENEEPFFVITLDVEIYICKVGFRILPPPTQVETRKLLYFGRNASTQQTKAKTFSITRKHSSDLINTVTITESSRLHALRLTLGINFSRSYSSSLLDCFPIQYISGYLIPRRVTGRTHPCCNIDLELDGQHGFRFARSNHLPSHLPYNTLEFLNSPNRTQNTNARHLPSESLKQSTAEYFSMETEAVGLSQGPMCANRSSPDPSLDRVMLSVKILRLTVILYNSKKIKSHAPRTRGCDKQPFPNRLNQRYGYFDLNAHTQDC